MTKPLIAITMGDPAGIGPEVIAGAWHDARIHAWCRPFVVGNPDVMRRALQLVAPARGHDSSAGRTELCEIDSPDELRPSPALLSCLRAGSDEAADVAPGLIDARGGQAAYDALVASARLALAGRCDAIITAPLSKAALWKAGHHYPGHTELLAELCGIGDYAMMLYLSPEKAGTDQQIQGPFGLGVAHVTLHMSMRDIFAKISAEAIKSRIHLADTVMRSLGATRPRIAVCALNPHAGESGLFGDEEQSVIEPAVASARAEGFDVHGPFPTDSLMVRARQGEFDAVVAMYHDQGHIALKLLGMHRAVNITLGLPIVRTSVAHGTAFDLAWQGCANYGSMIEAIRVASHLAENRSNEG